MILIECQQGSPEWIDARVGVITASKFRDAIEVTKTGDMTAKSNLYAAQIAIERISKQSNDDTFQSWQMRRGIEIEPEARMAYEVLTGNLALEAGVALTNDGKFGYSTDGLVEKEGLLEIKCLSSPMKIIEIWRTQDLSEYMHQMQGGMWITGRKWCDFVMYCPQLLPIGKEVFYQRVMRDDEFIATLEDELIEFEKIVTANEHALRNMH